MKSNQKNSSEKIRLIALNLAESYENVAEEEINHEFEEVFSDPDEVMNEFLENVNGLVLARKKSRLAQAQKKLHESKEITERDIAKVPINELKDKIKNLLNKNEKLNALTLAFRNQNLDDFDKMAEDELTSIWEDLNDLLSENDK